MTDKNLDEIDAAGDPGEQDVYTAYFYYIKYTSPTQYSVKTYVYFDKVNKITNRNQLTEALAAHATIGSPMQNVTYGGNKVDRIQRERKGFVIIALDGAEFLTGNPVVFYCDDAVNSDSIGNDGQHTFFPRQGHDFEVPNGPPISSVAYLYWAQSHKHNVELDDREWEHFTIKFSAQSRTLSSITFEESGGTNMGPPPPPPARIHGPARGRGQRGE